MTGSGRLRRIGATIAMALLASSWLSAYQFSPLEQTFEPSGGGATRTYTIVNDSDDTIAVRISALTRDQDADGARPTAPRRTISPSGPRTCSSARRQARSSA